MKSKAIYLCSFLFILIFFSVVLLTGNILSLPYQNNIGEPPDKLKLKKYYFQVKVVQIYLVGLYQERIIWEVYYYYMASNRIDFR